MSTTAVFPEENLSLSAIEGCGFFPATPGHTLNNGRYRVVRKLGRGRFSSTWLVADSKATSLRYLAVKILTAKATGGPPRNELEYLKAIRDLGDDRSYLPLLRDDFEESGPHGVHLCLVMDVLSTDISSFRRAAPFKHLSLRMAKMIVALIVESLESLHDLNIIHADLKLDNVLFACPYSHEDIHSLLCKDGSAIVDGEFELHGQRYPIVRSQPLIHQFPHDASPHLTELLTVYLTDFGHALKAGTVPQTDEISPYALRAPEVILGAKFDMKIDVWALGCITFELLMGRWLFDPEAGECWRREDDHLAKMMELTGQKFHPSLLQRSRFRDDYFDTTGNLLRIDELCPMTLEEAFANYKVLEAKDIGPAAQFIRDCLSLNPVERLSIKDVQDHAWLRHAFGCAG